MLSAAVVDAASLDAHAPVAQRAQSLDEFKKLGKVITGREQSDAETLEQMRRADKDRNALLRSVGFPAACRPSVGAASACRSDLVLWDRVVAAAASVVCECDWKRGASGGYRCRGMR